MQICGHLSTMYIKIPPTHWFIQLYFTTRFITNHENLLCVIAKTIIFLIGFYRYHCKQNSVKLSCCRRNNIFLGTILCSYHTTHQNLISNLGPYRNEYNGYVHRSYNVHDIKVFFIYPGLTAIIAWLNKYIHCAMQVIIYIVLYDM